MAVLNRVLMSGNEAIAEGALHSGCEFYAGYPITPQNELIAYMGRHLPEQGGVFIQAESEIAAINMVYGAAAAGKRAMTSSSSPGVSLKQEGISYLCGAQLPAVLVNIMRGGPGLGNIMPAQSDYFQATRGGGHGDYRTIVLAPSTVGEAYNLTGLAFELADTYRNPAMILGDGILGQMMEPIVIKKFKKSNAAGEKSWALTGCKGRKPNVVKSFFIKDGDLEIANILLQKKYALISRKEQRAESFLVNDAQLILVAYGTMARIVKGLVLRLRQQGEKIGLIRPISLWPFPDKAFQKIPKGVKYLAVEMSYGQMVEDVRLAVGGKALVSFLGRGGGGIPQEKEIIASIRRLESLKG